MRTVFLLFSLVFGIFFFIIVAIFLLRASASGRRVDVNAKMQPYLAQRAAAIPRPRRRSPGQLLEAIVRMVRPIGESIASLPQAIRMERLMQQADLPFRGSDFLVLMFLIGIIVFLLASLILQDFFFGFILGIAAVIFSIFWVKLSIQRRRKAFGNQLGDALVMMANALRAGFSFNQTMSLIGREMTPPISDEFTKTVMEMQLGASAETALDNMARRVQSKDFDLVVTAVLIQRQVGGNLSQILDTVANTIMERVRMKREITALTAQGRLSGYVLVCLPFGFAAIMYFMNPTYMMPMFTEPLGRILIGVGIFLDFIGLLVIRKLVNIEL